MASAYESALAYETAEDNKSAEMAAIENFIVYILKESCESKEEEKRRKEERKTRKQKL